MGAPTRNIRQANNHLASEMASTGGSLLLLAVLFGGSAFFLQWGFWFILAGYAIHSVVRKGADATDWVIGKMPSNPFSHDTKGQE